MICFLEGDGVHGMVMICDGIYDYRTLELSAHAS